MSATAIDNCWGLSNESDLPYLRQPAGCRGASLAQEREGHVALENAILRRRGTSAFSHGQDQSFPTLADSFVDQLTFMSVAKREPNRNERMHCRTFRTSPEYPDDKPQEASSAVPR
jgi:hypothetical protein